MFSQRCLYRIYFSSNTFFSIYLIFFSDAEIFLSIAISITPLLWKICRHKYFKRRRFDLGMSPADDILRRDFRNFRRYSRRRGNVATRDTCRTHVDCRIKPFVKLRSIEGREREREGVSSEFLDAPIAGIDSSLEPEAKAEDVG